MRYSLPRHELEERRISLSLSLSEKQSYSPNRNCFRCFVLSVFRESTISQRHSCTRRSRTGTGIESSMEPCRLPEPGVMSVHEASRHTAATPSFFATGSNPNAANAAQFNRTIRSQFLIPLGFLSYSLTHSLACFLNFSLTS